MKQYDIKFLIRGYKVGLKDKPLLVALPDKYLNQDVEVFYNLRRMKISKNTKLLTYRVFDDKFGRDKTYRLAYYEWRPDGKKMVFKR